MADFAEWATAIGPAGTFMRAYDANRADVVDTLLATLLKGSHLSIILN